MGLLSSVYLWQFASRLHHQKGLNFLPKCLKAFSYIAHRNLLSYQAILGEGLILHHHGLGVVVHPNTTIGDRVQIWHGVTIAAETKPGSEHRVIIEDDVVLGAHSIIVGRGDKTLIIGKGAVVGAGAVVTRSVAPSETVVGSPARPLSKVENA